MWYRFCLAAGSYRPACCTKITPPSGSSCGCRTHRTACRRLVWGRCCQRPVLRGCQAWRSGESSVARGRLRFTGSWSRLRSDWRGSGQRHLWKSGPESVIFTLSNWKATGCATIFTPPKGNHGRDECNSPPTWSLHRNSLHCRSPV